MRKQFVTHAALGFLLAGSTFVFATPPARPLPVTANQFTALRQLEQQPEHQQVLDTRATYQSEHEKVVEETRNSDDFWTAFAYGAYPAVIVALLIAGAPL